MPVVPDDQPPISVHLLAYLFDPLHPGFAAERARLRTSGSSAASGSSRRSPPPGTRWRGRSGSSSGPTAVSSVARTSRKRWWRRRRGLGRPPSHRCCTTEPYYATKADTDVREGSRWSVPGGVPVFAHGLATKRGRIVGDDAIAAMVEAGLLGLEVDHPDHAPTSAPTCAVLAADLGLIVTGSSDYHGSNKATPRRLHDRSDQFEAILAAGTGSAPFRD